MIFKSEKQTPQPLTFLITLERKLQAIKVCIPSFVYATISANCWKLPRDHCPSPPAMSQSQSMRAPRATLAQALGSTAADQRLSAGTAEACELGHIARFPVSRGLSMNHTSSDRN